MFCTEMENTNMGLLKSLPAKGALCAFIALGGIAVPARAAHAQQAPPVNGAAFRGQGRLAFLWNSNLYLIDGERGTVRQIASPGPVTAMAWPADGHWLAYIRP